MGEKVMQRILRIHIVLAGICAAYIVASGGAFAAPVALVLDVAGVSGANVIEAFSEIEAGGKIDLGVDGRLEFLDYNSCKNVTVTGGRIIFTARKFLLRGGKVVESSRGRCPKVVTLNKDARVGGVLLRASPATLRLKARPRFAFTGAKGDTVARVRILQDESEILALPLTQRLLDWPEDKAPLSIGGYRLEILTKSGLAAKRLPFEVTAVGGNSPLTIIRMD